MESLKQRIERLGGDVNTHRSIAQMVADLANDHGIKITPHECVRSGFSQVMNRIEESKSKSKSKKTVEEVDDDATETNVTEIETKPVAKRKQSKGKGHGKR